MTDAKRKELAEDMQGLRQDLVALAIAFRETDPAKSFGFFRRSEICGEVLKALRATAHIDVEGHGTTWWDVCEDCHGAVDRSDRFCKHCGVRLVAEE